MDRSKWEYKPFEECIEKSKKTKQLMTPDYQPDGAYPIISQEACLISGYTDDPDYVNHFNRPVVIFGDHTRVLKYVDFDFAVGADGVKILIPHTNLDAKFLLSFLTWYKIPNLGYSRHYKLLKEISVPVPPIADQQWIVAELDCLNEMIAVKQEQLKEFDKLAQSIFYDMFGDSLTNDKGWDMYSLFKLGVVTTGNTPSRKVADYYEKEYIEWIKTDNIDKASLYPSQAKEYLSESGAKVGRIVEAGSLLVTCIAGSLSSIGGVCITNRRVAFNQQINAITPNETMDSVFLYHLIKNSGKYIRENATNGMKHIITKSTFENLIFPLPPLSLQQQFAEKISAIEAQKELVKQSIAETQSLLDYTMDKYFG